jgi:hypothetical protein
MHFAYSLSSSYSHWNIMKSLIEKLFKKEPQFNYVIAEYLPTKTIPIKPTLIKKSESKTSRRASDYIASELANTSEKEISSLYQNL